MKRKMNESVFPPTYTYKTVDVGRDELKSTEIVDDAQRMAFHEDNARGHQYQPNDSTHNVQPQHQEQSTGKLAQYEDLKRNFLRCFSLNGIGNTIACKTIGIQFTQRKG